MESNYALFQERIDISGQYISMSFWKKLFGWEEEKPKPVKPVAKTEAELMLEKQFKIETTRKELDAKIKGFEEKEKKFANQIDMLDRKASELMVADQQVATKYVAEATRRRKEAEGCTFRKRELMELKFNLERAIMDIEKFEVDIQKKKDLNKTGQERIE